MKITRISRSGGAFGIRLECEKGDGSMATVTARDIAARIIEACDREDAARDRLTDALASSFGGREEGLER